MQGGTPSSDPTPAARGRVIRTTSRQFLVDMGDKRGNGPPFRKVTRLLSGGHHKQNLGLKDYPDLVPVNLSFAPNTTSGYNVCPCASPGCIFCCTYKSGLGNLVTNSLARIARTRFFFQNRELFLERLHEELGAKYRSAEDAKKRLAFRPNNFSDLPWEVIDPAIFSKYPDVQFYDYTKIASRMFRADLPPNYHLTFSLSEVNEKEALEVLAGGGNVTVVYDVAEKAELPPTWRGHPVDDGDEHDYRFKDKSPRVIGLRVKTGPGHGDTTGFVLRAPFPL